MGLRDDSSNGPDWRDVVAQMDFIESITERSIEIRMRRIGTGKFATLVITMEAAGGRKGNAVLVPSAFAQTALSIGTSGGLSAELHSLLYELDFAVSEADALARTLDHGAGALEE